LIVDDVWQHTLANHFRVGGPHCRLLITTRDAEVAHALDAQVHPIPLMTTDEAVALLGAWANGAVAEVESAMQQQIIQRLGRLPLAVKLAGAQLRRQRPSDWLRRFDVRTLRSSRPESLHDSLEQTFKLSLADLDAQVQRLYAALVIFREDQAIPDVGILRLWEGLAGFDGTQAAEVIDDLAARALLQVSAGSPRTIVLHDLLRDLMRGELAEEVTSVHGALLHAYAHTRRGNGWHTAPDDGYLYTHLAYHLVAAGRKDELCTLLTASPAWMEAKYQALSGDMSYAADVDVALTAWEGAATTPALVQLAQLSAVRHVVQQRVSVYTNTDLETLVWLGRDAEALSHARLRPDPREKSLGLLRIHAVQRAQNRAEGRVLVEALEAARAIEDAELRAEALQAVAAALAQGGQGDLALEAVRAIEDAGLRAEALQAVAAALAQGGQFWKAFFIIRPLDLHSFLGAIAQWLPSLKKLEATISLRVVSEVVRITGWVWPQWHTIYDILATSR
jgi:hypothetical protein